MRRTQTLRDRRVAEITVIDVGNWREDTVPLSSRHLPTLLFPPGRLSSSRSDFGSISFLLGVGLSHASYVTGSIGFRSLAASHFGCPKRGFPPSRPAKRTHLWDYRFV